MVACGENTREDVKKEALKAQESRGKGRVTRSVVQWSTGVLLKVLGGFSLGRRTNVRTLAVWKGHLGKSSVGIYLRFRQGYSSTGEMELFTVGTTVCWRRGAVLRRLVTVKSP